jgi:RNA polymerase sigma-54 factor
MVLLQHKLNVKLSQRQILTPGLVQMVSVLALNKLELKDMINAEMVENPVLEELEDAVPLLDDVGRQEEERDRLAAKATTTEEGPATIADEKKDPFEEIDFGSFFQDYLDPGYRSSGEMEEIEKPSFENFLSKPGNLSDHLLWQLGAISVRPSVHQAAEQIIGNLNEEGSLVKRRRWGWRSPRPRPKPCLRLCPQVKSLMHLILLPLHLLPRIWLHWTPAICN